MNKGEERGPEELQRPVMPTCGERVCSLWQGQDPHPTLFPLQDGYII